jgi:hypothetical protein
MSNDSRIRYSWAADSLAMIPTPYSQTGATDRFTIAASQMALVHNGIFHGFNSIYL